MNVFVGIDIAAKTVELVIHHNKNSSVKTLTQTENGRATLVKLLQQHKLESVVMEAIGIYYLDLTVAL